LTYATPSDINYDLTLQYSNTLAPLSDDGLRYSANDLTTLNNLSVTNLSHIDSSFNQELHQALGQSVALVQHLLGNPRLTATTMVVDCDHLRQQRNQEQTAWQVAQNLVRQCVAEIQQLQTRNQETTAESNAYQDRITILQNELNHECANVEALWTVAAAAGTAPRQQPNVQPASIPYPEKFDGCRNTLRLFVFHLRIKFAGTASRFPNPQHQLQYTFGLLVGQAFEQIEA
jgi:hypothetical protein